MKAIAILSILLFSINTWAEDKGPTKEQKVKHMKTVMTQHLFQKERAFTAARACVNDPQKTEPESVEKCLKDLQKTLESQDKKNS